MKSTTGDASRSTSSIPTSRNHLNDFFCTSIRFGISRTSSILEKLFRSVFPKYWDFSCMK